MNCINYSVQTIQSLYILDDIALLKYNVDKEVVDLISDHTITAIDMIINTANISYIKSKNSIDALISLTINQNDVVFNNKLVSFIIDLGGQYILINNAVKNNTKTIKEVTNTSDIQTIEYIATDITKNLIDLSYSVFSKIRNKANQVCSEYLATRFSHVLFLTKNNYIVKSSANQINSLITINPAIVKSIAIEEVSLNLIELDVNLIEFETVNYNAFYQLSVNSPYVVILFSETDMLYFDNVMISNDFKVTDRASITFQLTTNTSAYSTINNNLKKEIKNLL